MKNGKLRKSYEKSKILKVMSPKPKSMNMGRHITVKSFRYPNCRYTVSKSDALLKCVFPVFLLDFFCRCLDHLKQFIFYQVLGSLNRFEWS